MSDEETGTIRKITYDNVCWLLRHIAYEYKGLKSPVLGTLKQLQYDFNNIDFQEEYANMIEEILEGNKIKAIKIHRMIFTSLLRTAREEVEKIMEGRKKGIYWVVYHTYEEPPEDGWPWER